MSKSRTRFSPKWIEAKAQRRERRDALRKAGLLSMQPRNARGFIVTKTGGLRWDTQLAYDTAMIAERNRMEEEFAEKFERKQRQSARAQQKRSEPKSGPVTSNKKGRKES